MTSNNKLKRATGMMCAAITRKRCACCGIVGCRASSKSNPAREEYGCNASTKRGNESPADRTATGGVWVSVAFRIVADCRRGACGYEGWPPPPLVESGCRSATVGSQFKDSGKRRATKHRVGRRGDDSLPGEWPTYGNDGRPGISECGAVVDGTVDETISGRITQNDSVQSG
jgi:hypothetical protein